MEKANLLIEIGVEEIPAESIGIAAAHIESSFNKLISDTGLHYSEVRYYSTPRRLALIVTELDLSQENRSIVKTGPAVSIAYDAEGNLSPAGLGFLRKIAADPQDVSVESNEKGSFITVRQEIIGRSTSEILTEWFGSMVDTIPFPKKMVWNSSKGKYIRPLRWIVALLGDQILPLNAYDVVAGRTSRGIRWMGLDTQIQIDAPMDYEDRLAQQKVIPDRTKRRAIILEQLERSVSGGDQQVLGDPRLVETVTDLVEYPTAVVAEFDEKFLVLPDKIITSTISQNQKYFSVMDAQGRLTNKFVFISNGDPAFSDTIKLGNEKVVRGRLADAEWYYQEDIKQPLAAYNAKLEEVVFHAKLGTVAGKRDRIIRITEDLSAQIGLSPEQALKAKRAAELCKADLVTTMLGEKEFTKLQGYVGKQYALVGGEDPEVAEAIYEHYMPKGQGDQLPFTTSGAIVAIADKIDTVCGIIGIGMLPTGSGDPFALRRAAGGVVQILSDKGWNIDLHLVLRNALASFDGNENITADAETQIIQFFNARVKWLLQQANINYDVIDSVMHTDMAHIPDIEHRAKALQNARDRSDFVNLVKGFKRVSNIISAESAFGDVDPLLLTETAEQELHHGLSGLRTGIDAALSSYDYPRAIDSLIGFGAAIDRFFDEVLVNAEDQALKQNRYNLMHLIRREFLRVADLSLIVIE